LGRRKALGMLLETLDTEELRADGLFVIPWCSLRLAPEGAKNCRFQF
jgi:predicted GNAT family acetyltransferase